MARKVARVVIPFPTRLLYSLGHATPRVTERHPMVARAPVFSLYLLAAPLLTCGCSLFRDPVPESIPVHHVAASGGELRAGAALVDITPEGPVWMGGYQILRESEGVHDPLYARAVVLERGEVELALVAVDVVGLQHQDVRRIQHDMVGIDPRHVVIAATHNHNGPDTIGIWGFPPFMSGADRSYLRKVRHGVLEALQRARESLRPAEVGFGSVMAEPEGLLKNYRRPGMVDREIVVLHLREPAGGATIATLTELGCHPEVLERWNTQITADFPGWTVARIEAELGGVAVHVSGALGGLVAPDVQRSEPPDPAEEWQEAERLGHLVADHAIGVVRSLESYDARPELALWHSPLYLRNHNFNYDLIRWTGILDRKVYGSGYFRTEVSLWQVGRFRLATVPGEITPDVGLRIKANAGGEPTMLVGLANDELGYLLSEAEYALPIFQYERMLCPGPEAADRIARMLEDLALLAGK